METHPCNFPQVCPQVGRKGPGCCGSLSPALNPHNPQPRLRRRPHAVDSRLSSRTRTPRTRHDMTSVTPRPPTARPRHRLQAMSPASSHLIVTFCPRLRNCPGLQLVADSPGGPVRHGHRALVAVPKLAATSTARPRPWWVSAWIVRPSRDPVRDPEAAGPAAQPGPPGRPERARRAYAHLLANPALGSAVPYPALELLARPQSERVYREKIVAPLRNGEIDAVSRAGTGVWQGTDKRPMSLRRWLRIGTGVWWGPTPSRART